MIPEEGATYRARYVSIQIHGVTPRVTGQESPADVITFSLPGTTEKLHITRGVFEEWYIPVVSTTAEIGGSVG